MLTKGLYRRGGGGGFLTGGQCNVTLTNLHRCSLLQQWRFDAVIGFFAAYIITLTRNALLWCVYCRGRT